MFRCVLHEPPGESDIVAAVVGLPHGSRRAGSGPLPPHGPARTGPLSIARRSQSGMPLNTATPACASSLAARR